MELLLAAFDRKLHQLELNFAFDPCKEAVKHTVLCFEGLLVILHIGMHVTSFITAADMGIYA